MIRAEQIPNEVVEAAAKSMGWTSAIVLQRDRLRFKGHIAAAINAWPMVNLDATRTGIVILHLPQEPRDE